MQIKDHILYHDLHLEPDTEYFLYIGELKANCLNQFLKESLSRIFARKFDFISILPDVLSRYPRQNILVINPRSNVHISECGKKVCCRLSGKEFNRTVSESETVNNLIHELSEKQSRVFIHVYESMPEMTLPRIPGVSLLGPEPELADQWNNKHYQLQIFQNTTVPVINFKICENFVELLQVTDKLWNQWKDGIFISQPYSAAGMNSFIAHAPEDIKAFAGRGDSKYLASKYIPHVSDPTVLGVVANPNDVYIAAVADQEIEGGNTFKGSVFPSALPLKIQDELKEHTRTVGRLLGQSGYRGIFGCDFIVDDHEQIHFVELNARKQGTTMEMTCTLENLLPADAASLLEIEFFAITEGRIPENAMETTEISKNIHWRTYNFKTDKEIDIQTTIPQEHDERQLFKAVAENRMERGMIIMEHLGQGLQAEAGTFVGRIAAVSKKRECLDQDIQTGKELLKRSILTKEGQ